MKWWLSSLIPSRWTGCYPALRRKRVEVPVVAIIRFRDGKLAHEHIYWDQASVLVQLGLLNPVRCPLWALTVQGADPNCPQTLIHCASDATMKYNTGISLPLVTW